MTTKKTWCFETIFQNFLARAPPFKKRSFFTQFLPPLIRTQAGVKSGQLAQLHLNSTFCLAQSLPQSCNTKNWGRLSGPQNAVNYGVSWTYHAFYCKKSAPPQLKLTVLVPPEWHAFCTYGAGGFVFWLLRFFLVGEMAWRWIFPATWCAAKKCVTGLWHHLERWFCHGIFSSLSNHIIHCHLLPSSFPIFFPPFFIIFSPFFVDFLIICLQCHVSPGNKALWENDC